MRKLTSKDRAYVCAAFAIRSAFNSHFRRTRFRLSLPNIRLWDSGRPSGRRIKKGSTSRSCALARSKGYDVRERRTAGPEEEEEE